jgi:RNA polymerase sigma-70 factor, ECF subfamily
VAEYSLQPRSAAEHATAADTDWPKIAALYADLERLAPSPVVRLNRAVAVAEAGSPEAALALLDGLDADLGSHHLLPSVRAELLLRLGRRQEAAAAFTNAMQFAGTRAEKNHLRRRLGQFD